MAGVRGDFQKLHQLVGRLERLVSRDERKRVNQQLALETRDLVQESIQNSRSPFGRPYRPLKRRVGKPLMDTRRLYNSFTATATERGYKVGSRVVYAAVHNYGYRPRNIPARPFLPTRGRIPGSWRRRLERVATAAMRRVMLGRA